MSKISAGFYVTGGTLRSDAPSYVTRQADSDLYDGLTRGEFCYVLTARQMGKSSLMVRTATRLRDDGVAAVVLDLTAVGQNLSPEQWYDGLIAKLGAALELEEELEGFWEAHPRLGPLQRWMAALHQVVLPRVTGRIVIFVDEIDTVKSLPFSTDEFFAAIRECYNRRTEDPELARLTFCLLGVASPSDLIRDTRLTPFNIGRRIELTDFTEAEAAPLATGLSSPPTQEGLTSPPAPPRSGEGRKRSEAPPPRFGEAGEPRLGRAADSGGGRAPGGGRGQPLLQRILYWTGGHPYLTQRLCRAVAEEGNVMDAVGVDRLCEALFLTARARERDDNLLFVRERLLRSDADRASLLDLYARVQRGRRVLDDEANPLVSLLRLSGITRTVDGALRVRNRIYAQVFDRQWVTANLPDAELRRQRAAYRRGLTRAAALSGVILALVGGLALTAVNQAHRADAGRREAQEQRRVALGGQRALRRHLYAAQMGLAQQAWDAGNVGRALELVEAQRPGPGQEDLRGFEWRYLWRLCHRDTRFVFHGHTAVVTSVAFSPDGKLLASASDDRTIKLWDLASQRELATLRGHTSAVHGVRFSPDGKLLASGSGDRTVRLWNVASRREAACLRGQKESVWAVAFSPDGRTLASGAEDLGSIKLWEIASRRQVATLTASYSGDQGVGFSPDGRTLAWTDKDGSVKLWDQSSRRLAATISRHEGGSLAVAFSPDGRTLAVGRLDGKLVLWEVATARAVATLKGHEAAIHSLAFSPNGKLLASAARDGTVRVWDVDTRRERVALRGHTQRIWDVAFSPNGRTLASAGDLTVRLWNVATQHSTDLLRGPKGGVDSVAFSRDGKTLATGGADQILRLWDVATQREIAALRGHQADIECVAFSPDGRVVASGSDDRTIKLWDPAWHRCLATLRGHQTVPWRIAFSPDGKILATCADRVVKLWDVATRREVASIEKNSVDSLAFLPTGEMLVGTSDLRTVWRWEMATKRERSPLEGTIGNYMSSAVSPDGATLVAGCWEGLIGLWDLNQEREVATFQGHPTGILTIAFAPDGRTFATGGVDKTVKLWNVATRQEMATLRGHTDWVLWVAFSPDGSTLASASRGGTVRLWHAAPLAQTDAPAALPPRVSSR